MEGGITAGVSSGPYTNVGITQINVVVCKKSIYLKKKECNQKCESNSGNKEEGKSDKKYHFHVFDCWPVKMIVNKEAYSIFKDWYKWFFNNTERMQKTVQ